MAEYKWTNAEKTAVLKYDDSWHIVENGRGWPEFQEYLNQGGEVDPYQTKDDALNEMLTKIDQQNHTENHKDFPYDKGDGTGLHNYEADDQSIQATQNQCMTMDPADPIPVPNGVWKTNDTEVDGLTPIYVPFTVGEFISFATAYFMRGSNNFGVKETHKNNVKAIYADPNSTVDDILNYDITTGWF